MDEVIKGKPIDVTGSSPSKGGGGGFTVSNPVAPISDVLTGSPKDVSKIFTEKSLSVENPDSVATSKKVS